MRPQLGQVGRSTWPMILMCRRTRIRQFQSGASTIIHKDSWLIFIDVCRQLGPGWPRFPPAARHRRCDGALQLRDIAPAQIGAHHGAPV